MKQLCSSFKKWTKRFKSTTKFKFQSAKPVQGGTPSTDTVTVPRNDQQVATPTAIPSTDNVPRNEQQLTKPTANVIGLHQNFEGMNIETIGNIGSFNNIATEGGVIQIYEQKTTLPLPKPVHKWMPSSSPNFVGCEDHLQRLHDYFHVKPANETRRRTFVLFGVGGVGKTQISLKFAEQSSNRFWQIFWIDASSHETIEGSFQAVCDPITGSSGPEQSTEATLQWLSRIKHDWLLIFDNADHEPDMVEKFLPPGNQGNILITSRNQNMQCLSPDGSFAEIVQMEKESSISLLLKSASLNPSDKDLRILSEKIVEELCFLPLAVHQAGAAITSGLCGIGEYLKMYCRHHQRLLDNPRFKGASNYGRAVYGTWDVSFTEMVARAGKPNSDDGQAASIAIFLLQMFSFFHCEGITEEIFCRAAEASKQATGDTYIDLGNTYPNLTHQVLELDARGAWDPIWFREGICVLLSFSFIRKSEIDNVNVYSVHGLVHSWSRDRISKSDCETIACCARRLLSQSITSQYMGQDIAFRRTLVPHIKATQQHFAEKGVRKAYDDVEGTNFGLVYYEKGYWKEAEELQVQVVDTRKKQLGAEHPDTLSSIGSLASTYRNQGQWKKAEELEVQVMETNLRLLGAEHHDTLTSINNLALTYLNQGQWKKSEELQVQVMETSVRLFGAEHSDTLSSINNLALTYMNQGQWKQAEELQVQVMETSLRLLGPEHPYTLKSISNLASTFWNQGQLKKAEELEVQLMETRKRLLGAEHPDTLASIGNLALTYRNQGQWKKAEELQVEVMETRKRLFGAEHPGTLSSIGNLASTYRNQGQWKKAEVLEVQVLETSSRLFGVEHPDTLTSANSLALTYMKQGQWKQAEELQVQVMETRKRLFGAEHPDTLTTIGKLVSSYMNQGQWKKAEELQVQVMETNLRLLGAEHPDTLASIGSFALIYRNLRLQKNETEPNEAAPGYTIT